MRVLFNGVTTLKPKTGIAHAAANLHNALVANFPADTFWLYPGERVAGFARRFFRPVEKHSAGPTKTGRVSRTIKHLAKRTAGTVAKLGYATHFQTIGARVNSISTTSRTSCPSALGCRSW